MNNHKFDFIICTNNQQYLDECINYINLLNIPDGYEIDLLTIEDASSITSGYNEGMNASDAKYKIYMHQDVFIINRNFLYDILTIFESDSKIGLIGMVGYTKVSEDAVMWNGPRVGCTALYGGLMSQYPTYQYTTKDILNYRYSFSTDGITDVALIDGLMMVTSADLTWDEATLNDWDFYDAFQSINFIENNYRVVVPNQNIPWFIHDDGVYLSMFNYGRNRQLFIEKYGKYLGLSIDEIRKMDKKI